MYGLVRRQSHSLDAFLLGALDQVPQTIDGYLARMGHREFWTLRFRGMIVELRNSPGQRETSDPRRRIRTLKRNSNTQHVEKCTFAFFANLSEMRLAGGSFVSMTVANGESEI